MTYFGSSCDLFQIDRLKEQRASAELEVDELRARCEHLAQDIASREEQIHQGQLHAAEIERTLKFKEQEVSFSVICYGRGYDSLRSKR